MSATDKTKLDGVATNANNYVHPTTAGNKHIPNGGTSRQILKYSAAGTASWGYHSWIAEGDATLSKAQYRTISMSVGLSEVLILISPYGNDIDGANTMVIPANIPASYILEISDPHAIKAKISYKTNRELTITNVGDLSLRYYIWSR